MGITEFGKLSGVLNWFSRILLINSKKSQAAAWLDD
jgi:hypothetical protein